MIQAGRKHLILKLLRLAFTLLVVGGVIGALWRLMRRWDGSQVHIHWVPLFAALLVLVMANALQGLGWLRLLERMAGKSLSPFPVLTVFMAAQLARYAPGKVGVPMVRIAGARKMGVPARLVGASVAIDVGTWMGLGAIMSCISLLSSDPASTNWLHLSRGWLWSALLVFLLGLLAALFIDRKWFPRFVVKLLQAELGQGPFVSAQVVWMQLLSWCGWWVFGLLMPMSIGGTFMTALDRASIFVIAPIVGFLAMVAPGGLGVREAFISYALAPSFGASAALAASLLARGVAIASELIGWLLALLWERLAARASAIA